MTNSEKTIFELFSDLRAITNYMNDSESLKNFYIKAVGLFNNKNYSDVNLQDDDGNTLLHYAMKANDVDWSEKILRRGANPYIKNNEGKNCFLMFSNGFSDNFMEKFRYIYLNDKFNIKTLGFSKEFKQALFDTIAEKSQFFQSIEEINDFLRDSCLYSIKNSIKLLTKSPAMNIDEQVSSYMTYYDSPDDNSFFFNQFAHKIFKVKNQKLEKSFFERSFSDNNLFFSGVFLLAIEMNEANSLKDTMNTVIKLMLDRKFNMKQLTGVRDETIEDFLVHNAFTKKIYLKEKLENELTKDSYAIKNNKKI